MAAISFLGFIVWGHHMFQSGMNPTLGRTFMVATMLIALPSAIKTFNWLGTIYRSQITFTPPVLYCLGFISMWIIGGLSGIFMAATPVDVQIHDTYAIVAHFHYVVFGATLLAVFAGLYYWFPKMFGRFMNPTLAKIHFWITFLAFNGTFFPMHVLGSQGMLRRTQDPYFYGPLQGMLPMNQFMTICALTMGAAQLLLAFNFFYSMFAGRKCTERNPWHATTIEWSTPTPPVAHGNFDQVPHAYRGAFEYGVDGPDGDDYLPQFVPPAKAPTPSPAHATH
jgi:cytochrome c oxidase subunit 1